jgi:hypothetical protein
VATYSLPTSNKGVFAIAILYPFLYVGGRGFIQQFSLEVLLKYDINDYFRLEKP